MHKFRKMLLIAAIFFIVLNFRASSGCYPFRETDSSWSASSFYCGICGFYGSLPKYRNTHLSSIGLLHLRTLEICDTRIRLSATDENAGTEPGGHDGILFGYCNFGEKYGYAHISSMPNRGITAVDITYGYDDEIDFTFLEENLCPDCLNKILTGYREAGADNCRNLFLIDFQTMEIYPLPENVVSFMQNDYYFHIDHAEGRDRVLIFYVPGRQTVK